MRCEVLTKGRRQQSGALLLCGLSCGRFDNLSARNSKPVARTYLGILFPVRMRCRALLALVLFLGPGTRSFAVEGGYLALTIVRAEQKARDRVVAYVVNTPIYQEDPYFEVTVRAGETVIVGEREPANRREMLPDNWKPGAAVEGRVDKHHLFLRRPNGTEMRFIIIRRAKTPRD